MQVRVAMAAQELLACGEKWNQGCDGGFPFLASKYSPAPTVVVGPVTASPSTVGLPVLGSSLRLPAGRVRFGGLAHRCLLCSPPGPGDGKQNVINASSDLDVSECS